MAYTINDLEAAENEYAAACEAARRGYPPTVAESNRRVRQAIKRLRDVQRELETAWEAHHGGRNR